MLKDKAIELLYSLANKTFYPLTKTMEIESLKKSLANVDYPHSVGRYIAFHLLLAVLVGGSALIAVIALMVTETLFHPSLLLMPLVGVIGVIALLLVWPRWDLSKKNKQISMNLPLAILTMSTVSEGGAPPQYVFDAIAGNPDYPRLGKECSKIQRFMNRLGLSFSKAISKEIEITSSNQFKTFLKELNTTIRSGGDLKEFMAKKADDAYFDYMLQLERSGERAETLGEIYSIIMIAAPLLLFFVVMLLGIFATEEGLFGMSTNQILNYGTWLVIPLANVVFIMVMSVLSPE